MHVPNYQAVFFRRQHTDLTNSGGLWDASRKMYQPLDFACNRSELSWKLPGEGKIRFAHLHDKLEHYKWKGAEVDLFVFDEVTEFTEDQFVYMSSRNRSTSPAPKWIRATCNPDAESWVRKYVDWYLTPEGFADPAKAGVVRWFARRDDTLIWGSSQKEVNDRVGDYVAQSFTFIPSKLENNPLLEAADPLYRVKLKGMLKVESARLLDGNWKVRPAAGDYFNRRDFPIIATASADAITARVRHWDLAASVPSTEYPDPDWTAGVLVGKYREGNRWVILDIVRGRWRAHERDEIIKRTAVLDGRNVVISFPQDPGQAGKDQVAQLTAKMAPNRVISRIESGEKVLRITPFASQCQAGNVDLVKADWNEAFLVEGENFPKKTFHDDQLDAATGSWLTVAKFNKYALL